MGKAIKIVSIDLDYFVDTTDEIRREKFPEPRDLEGNSVSEEWKKCYREFPELLDIEMTKEYDKAISLINNFPEKRKRITAKHSGIVPFIEEILEEGDNLHLINIDHHHDMYHYLKSGEKYNSSTWLRYIDNKFPDNKIQWVANLDSEIESLGGAFPYEIFNSLEEVSLEDIDYLHVCISPEWTPPHLISVSLEERGR